MLFVQQMATITLKGILNIEGLVQNYCNVLYEIVVK